MHRLIGPFSPTIAHLLVLAAIGAATPQMPPSPMPSGPPASSGNAVPIILNAPASLEALWERIRSPDFVLLRGDHYRELLKAAERDLAKGQPIVEAVAIRGVIDGRTAELEIEFRVSCSADGPTWIPIRLDGLLLSSARETGRTVPLRSGAGGGWEAQVRGSGKHDLRVALACRVSAAGDERRLELPIPLAGSTTLGVRLRDDPAEMILGPGETLIAARGPERPGGRFEAALRPRSRLEMRWRIAAEQGSDLPPLLGVQGDVAVEVSPDAVRTRTRWSIASLRGVTSLLAVKVDPGDELLDVELDGRAVPLEVAAAKGTGCLRIPLTEALRPGSPPQTLMILSLRRIADRAEPNVPIHAATIADSSLQGGFLGVSQNGSISIEARPARGLQRADPANDLPSILRGRPGTILAYRILDPAFELALNVQPSPAHVEVRTDAIMTVRPGTCAVEARMSFRTTPGRVFEVDFPAMPDEVIETPQPDAAVASSRWKTSERSKPGATGPSRVLSIQLTEKARESGSFALTLRTRRPLPREASPFEGRLPFPVGAESLGGRVAVVSTPEIKATLADSSLPAAARTFSRIEGPKQANWPWPTDRYIDLDPWPIWLSYEGEPRGLALDLSPQKTSYRSETVLTAQLGRTGVSYQSSVRLEVVGGLLDEFELLVPEGVEGDWSVGGLDIARRYPVQGEPTGERRYRVILAQKGNRMITFQLRYSTKFEAPLSASSPRAGQYAWIRPGSDADGPVRLVCESAPGVSAEIDAGGWAEQAIGATTDSRPWGRQFTRLDGSAGLPVFRAVAEPILPMPPLVVSRAHLKTIRGSDELRTTASFRVQSLIPSVVIALPVGSRWLQARLDGEPLVDVERAGPDRYRVAIPSAPERVPRVISIESACPAHASSSWQYPELVGAEVLESFWTVIVPMSHAVVGTPRRWTDQNTWRWRGYVWMRTPERGDAELQRWVEGKGPGTSDLVGDPPTQYSNQHAYLFRKSDGLAPLPLLILPRSILLVACSGGVAVIGLALVLMSANRRPIVGLALAMALALAAAWDIDLTLQALLCGVLGFLLTLVAAALQWAVNRRRAGVLGRIATSSAATAPPVAVSVPAIAEEALDGSTAIRARPPAIVDEFDSPSAPPPDATPSLSEIGVRP
jgi:hypothetical protein